MVRIIRAKRTEQYDSCDHTVEDKWRGREKFRFSLQSVLPLISRPGLANLEHSWWAGLVFGCSVMVLG